MGIVEVMNVTKKFPSSNGEVVAVDNISFKVKKGRVFGILGPNGAGKTTTLRMIATIYRPDSGRILVDGIDVIENPNQVRKRIAYMTQEPDLSPALSVRDYIIYYFRFRGLSKREARQRCDYALKTFNLKEHAYKKPFQLSTGLKRRIQLACVLLSNTPLVFLDEPTAGIDPKSKRETWKLIEEMVKEKGMTVLLTSHDLYEVEYLADEVLIINRGRIVAQGAPSELKERFGKTLRVVTRNPIGDFERLKRTLMELEDVKGVNPISANSFEVQLSSLDNPLNEVLQATISQELEVIEIFATTLNFEDVYLNIIDVGGEVDGETQ
ncbi:ABC transporter ATP-binding protein [Thermococcus alcaliphilus]|uniref:ABC transporter ATP-binding protein n=1 Tax=Thermococcus alcaliphilus TaxID=139207 RepID=UPI0020910ED5|nr:ABC transporter ATP-binding protein [Thermococcus alcaliphilus]MCO6041997.1 ABC transporter ATP-binding protein [Thermococcus alcaliphilus]